MTQKPLRDEFERSRAFASAVLLEKIVREAYENRRSSEVQPLQWSIMRYLGSESEGRCTIGWIASFLGLTHAPVVRAVKTLQKRDFVMYLTNPADGRSKLVKLTPTGWKHLKADPLITVAKRIERLTEEEKTALASAVKQLIANNDKASES